MLEKNKGGSTDLGLRRDDGTIKILFKRTIVLQASGHLKNNAFPKISDFYEKPLK